MFEKKAFGLAMALLFAPFAAMAEQPYVDIEQRLTAEQLREVDLSPAQLQLLNRMLREASAKTEQTEALRGRNDQSRASLIGFNDEAIKSRLKHDVSGWEPGTVFELENGQHWKVLKGNMKLRKALQAPEILVVPGIAGRWFLQVDEDLPKARVYRID
jgi:hypothetical protein